MLMMAIMMMTETVIMITMIRIIMNGMISDDGNDGGCVSLVFARKEAC